MGNRAAGVHAFFTRELWSRELASLPTFRRWWYSIARVVHLTGVNFVKDRCTWRASALTYITVLSLVPMLALGFSVAKGMGAYETLLNESIVPFLDRTFGPADGTASEEVVAAADALEDEATQGGEGNGSGAASPDPPEDGAADPGDATEPAGGPDDGSAQPPGPLTEETAATELGVAGAGGTEPGSAPGTGLGAESGAGPDTESAAGPDTEPETEPATDSEDSAIADASGGQDDLVETDEPGASGSLAEPTAAAGSEVRRAIDTVLGFVQATDVSKLGALGFLIVLWTVIKLLGAIELSFNDIWGVRKSRTLPRKLADYLSTIVLVPLLLVTSTGVANMARSDRVGDMMGPAGDSALVTFLSSLAVVWLGFAFAYLLMPNTRTRVSSALVGGIVGGTIWQLFQFAHLKLQVGVANYNAIYSTFAALPIFLFWVQSSWMTVLLGAEAAAAHQNQARHGQLVRSRDFDIALKEVLALRLAVRVASSFLAAEPAPRISELADDLGCPDRTLGEVARGLERAGILATLEADQEDPSLLLACDPDLVHLQHILDALKGDSLQEEGVEAHLTSEGQDAVVDQAFTRFCAERDATAANVTLRALAAAAGDGGHGEVRGPRVPQGEAGLG